MESKINKSNKTDDNITLEKKLVDGIITLNKMNLNYKLRNNNQYNDRFSFSKTDYFGPFLLISEFTVLDNNTEKHNTYVYFFVSHLNEWVMILEYDHLNRSLNLVNFDYKEYWLPKFFDLLNCNAQA